MSNSTGSKRATTRAAKRALGRASKDGLRGVAVPFTRERAAREIEAVAQRWEDRKHAVVIDHALRTNADVRDAQAVYVADADDLRSIAGALRSGVAFARVVKALWDLDTIVRDQVDDETWRWLTSRRGVDRRWSARNSTLARRMFAGAAS